MLLPEKCTLLFIGDSITDCGRRRPVGEAPDGLGGGYVAVVNALLQAACPEREVRVRNVGIGGNTVRDLKGRWQQDVVDLEPDWLSVMIGINDVWRQFDAPANPERHVYPPEYEETLRALVSGIRGAVRGLCLMTPYFIEADRADPMRTMMDRYGQIVRRAAADHDAIFVDSQAAFDGVLRHLDSAALAGDRVHPNLIGHTVLARAFLDAVGYDWSRRP